VDECRPRPVFASFILAFALQLRKKAWKNLSQGEKNLIQGKKDLSQNTVYILPKHPHITKPTHTHTHTNITKPTHIQHTLQNNIKPPQYKLKQTQYTILHTD